MAGLPLKIGTWFVRGGPHGHEGGAGAERVSSRHLVPGAEFHSPERRSLVQVARVVEVTTTGQGGIPHVKFSVITKGPNTAATPAEIRLLSVASFLLAFPYPVR